MTDTEYKPGEILCHEKKLQTELENKIKTYKQTSTDKLAKEISEMKPNTRKVLENGWSIDYFNIDSLKEHYILNMSTYSKLFASAIELAQYITK